MTLTARDRSLVAAVAELGVMTREQVAKHLNFGSTTRTNAILLRLARHGYLERRLQPTLRGMRRLTYHLGTRGAELLGQVLPTRGNAWRSASDLFIEHKLLVNDIRLAFQHAAVGGYRFERWLSEQHLKSMQFGFTPDGYIEYSLEGNRFALFVEADNGTESQTRWRGKVATYLQFAYSGAFERQFGLARFRVVVSAPSARRLGNIRQEIGKQTERIFWLVETPQLLDAGPFASIFSRPADASSQPLIPKTPT